MSQVQETKVHSTRIKSHYQHDGTMIVVPEAYVLKNKEDRFTFRNFYIEYGRFHMDETNTLIHCIFIPIIVGTMMGLVQHYESIKEFRLDTTGSWPSV